MGSDADLVIWDPEAGKTIKASSQQSAIDYNVFEGKEVKGLPRYTLSRGQVAVREGMIETVEGHGEFVPRPPQGRHGPRALHMEGADQPATCATLRHSGDGCLRRAVGRCSVLWQCGRDGGGVMAIIQAKGLDLTFQTNDGPVHALKGVDLDIEEGEFVSFIGPSGCGKTTFLRCIAALETPTGGTLTVRGGVSPEEARRARSYGYVSSRRGFIHGARLRAISNCRWKSWECLPPSKTSAWSACWSWSSCQALRKKIPVAAFGRDATTCLHRPRALV